MVDAQDAQDTAERLRAICGELSERFHERADVVRTLVVTLLAGQHSLVLGPPGTAKSEMARELTGRIEGAAYWEILLSKFTASTRMFGPIDVAALARGEYRQVYDGRATTAHVAFIDESRLSGGTLELRRAGPLRRHPPGAPTRTTIELGALRHAVTEAVPAVDVPDAIVDAVCTLRAAQAAAQALTAAAPGIRAAARSAAAQAAEAVRQEAALMRAWGVGSGRLERMPFAERARLAERLRGGRLAQWAELIGRFRQMARGERARKVENATGELVGVTLGDDLSRVIPSELTHLGLPELRAVFAARYAAGELMLYDSQSEQTTGQGAVIACVDTSHSMYEAGPGGVTREAWAKACALALLDQARHAGRDFVGILFSAADKLQVFRFPAGEPADLDRVLDFAETFLGGGTSYQRPLSAAGELLAEEFDDAARGRGDIVMLTDDDCGVTEAWMRGWKEAKHRLGFRVFGVAVGAPRVAESDSVLDALCDNLRSIEDLTDVHAAADLFRVI
ncbi:AAA family ATPase [Streptomyces tailanensis]|uniref:AAA family ATPase n=1 Tax=Streptomyces tailanensis TaxID=2569858 RepID=UPI001FE2FA60|nr:AAA family ATPase [Streptomyces tailanensis]